MTPPVERAGLVLVLLATLGLRSVRLDQPIVENYVGRQVPTAMVARNLDRGSGFLRPSLDTGPFPNLFLVEPPGFALAAVGVRRATGLGLEASGRLLSALAIVLAGWSIHGLTRRREGPAVALLAASAFGLFPLTIRYGRAFQPDASALALVLAGIRIWDDGEASASGRRTATGGLVLAVGLGLKVVFAFALVPLLVAVVPRESWKRGAVLALATLAPAALWYAWATGKLAEGSRASADNAAIWLGALVPTALLDPATLALFARYLAVRSFTPSGVLLGVASLALGRLSRFWTTWAIASALWLVCLAGKAHHEYYWMVLAPPLAVGLGRSLAMIAGRSRMLAIVVAIASAGMVLVQSASTFRTPAEWSAVGRASEAIQRRVPRGDWIVAPEALLYAADRRGCRLEADPDSARRAAGEWGERLPEDREPALALVELYRRRGARFFADVGDPSEGLLGETLHRAIRRRYHPVWVDEPGFLLVELNDPAPNDEPTHADRR